MTMTPRSWTTACEEMNEENLIPGNKRSHEESVENGRKGGIRSVEVRRERKKQQKAILDLLKADFGGKTVFERMIGGLAKRVIESGDQAAFEKLMEYAGTSVRLDLLQKDRELKKIELELRRAEAERRSPDSPDYEDTSAIDDQVLRYTGPENDNENPDDPLG